MEPAQLLERNIGPICLVPQYLPHGRQDEEACSVCRDPVREHLGTTGSQYNLRQGYTLLSPLISMDLEGLDYA